MRSPLKEIVSNNREARRSAEQSGHSERIPFIGINIRLSAASIRSRRAAKQKMKDILHFFLKRDINI